MHLKGEKHVILIKFTAVAMRIFLHILSQIFYLSKKRLKRWCVFTSCCRIPYDVVVYYHGAHTIYES